ncbi:SdpI family protein [Haloferax sp. DFSO60]|uniref:SdpI family protein n=1 Tax=Haloferax sp. DFSO60 TaxID=3388652 RepID=UPI00397B00CB
MNSTRRYTLAVVLVVLAGVLSVLAAPMLPDQIVSHWNAAGEPDGTMSKAFGLALLPVLSAVLLVFFVAVPRIDPYRENFATFRPYYDWLIVLVTAFLFVVHAGTIAYNLGYVFDFTLLVVAAVAVLFYYIGVLLTHAEQNWFVGVRTPWTLSSEEVWRRTHLLAGRLFKFTALVSLVGLLFGEYAVYFLLVPALATALGTVAYSYYLYEHIDHSVESPDTGL